MQKLSQFATRRVTGSFRYTAGIAPADMVLFEAAVNSRQGKTDGRMPIGLGAPKY
jgi:hypothetical protein